MTQCSLDISVDGHSGLVALVEAMSVSVVLGFGDNAFESI